MNRRSFLGTLLAGVGTLALPKGDALLWMPEPRCVTPVYEGACITLQQITTAMLEYFVEERPRPVRRVPKELIGANGLTHLLGVEPSRDAPWPLLIERDGLDRERFIRPMARYFSSYIEHQLPGPVTACGELESYIPGTAGCVRVTHEPTGYSIRGIYQYDIRQDKMRALFQMVVG